MGGMSDTYHKFDVYAGDFNQSRVKKNVKGFDFIQVDKTDINDGKDDKDCIKFQYFDDMEWKLLIII